MIVTTQVLALWGLVPDLLCFDVWGLPWQIWAFAEEVEVGGCKVGYWLLAELLLGYLLWVVVEELFGGQMA